MLTIENDILIGSFIRPADNSLHPNRQVLSELPLFSEVDVLESEYQHLDIDCLRLPTVDPKEVIGRTFIKNVQGQLHKFKVIEETDEQKYLCQIGDSHREEILNYNEIMDHVNRKRNCEECEETFSFDNILQHRKGRDRKYEVLVWWVTGETSWEPLKMMIKEDQITLAEYAIEHQLLNLANGGH